MPSAGVVAHVPDAVALLESDAGEQTDRQAGTEQAFVVDLGGIGPAQGFAQVSVDPGRDVEEVLQVEPLQQHVTVTDLVKVCWHWSRLPCLARRRSRVEGACG
ncbi:hypothetical protein ACQHIV_04105 [Kribbella sp. GL6]|uniref:hypothetical protein n=1 Tax=Kribbella sp. GL6 TaxID=3419765 RepID=UPI003CFEFED4